MRGFIKELRYRNVFRVAAAYVVIGWLIAQVADLATDAFNSPDWIMQLLIVALLLGLPIALFLAWAFELTPEGLMRADEVPVTFAKDPRAGRLLDIIVISTLAVAVLLLGWDKLQRTDKPADSVVSEKSIAVLPFDDFSPDGDQAWFADGLAEEILNSLARTPDLQVASRTSSFAFRGATHDIPTIARSLGVAHVLEGSVRRTGDRLRVTVQLIRATDDKHLWSRNFDGSHQDSISIQEGIAIATAKALKTAMNPRALASMLSAGTRSVEAYEIYLRGLALEHEAATNNDLSMTFDVIEVFNQAVALDPEFADAQLKLADLWESQLNPISIVYVSGGLSHAERRKRYDAAIAAAIKFARSEMTRAEAEMRAAAMDLRLLDQIRYAQRMVELEPDKRIGWAWLAHLYQAVGEFDKSRDAGLKAWAAPSAIDVMDGPIIESMQRSSPQDAVTLVDEVMQSPKPSPSILYQAHRALLSAGKVERAAGLISRYQQQTDDEEGVLLMRLRQTCAEGRTADAEQVYEALSAYPASQWLALKILGYDDRARETLRPLDAPETVVQLSSYLTYRFFEARDYPFLWNMLVARGVNRPPATPLVYRCPR